MLMFAECMSGRNFDICIILLTLVNIQTEISPWYFLSPLHVFNQISGYFVTTCVGWLAMFFIIVQILINCISVSL
jgi:hypothetical protein